MSEEEVVGLSGFTAFQYDELFVSFNSCTGNCHSQLTTTQVVRFPFFKVSRKVNESFQLNKKQLTKCFTNEKHK